MVRITLVLILISISTLARGSDWKHIGKTVEGDTVYIDAKSVLVEGDTRTFWDKVILKKLRTWEGKTVYANRFNLVINCAKRTLSALVVESLDSKGNKVLSLDLRREPNFRDSPIPPDSIYESMRKYVCSIKKSPGSGMNK